MSQPTSVPSMPRSRLLSLLSEACELEHGLACSYLYSAFTIKNDVSEGGITWEQQQLIRKWAAQIYFVASEEMLHLAQAWNLLAAIGGTPYYLRPNFPQDSKYYPLEVPLLLEPFGLEAMRRFIYYERPAPVTFSEAFCQQLGMDKPTYSTVGELYGLIRAGIESFCEAELFIGDPANQVGPELVDFPDLIKVVNRATAVQAIEMITEQGEGNQMDSPDCHYGAFLAIERELLAEMNRAKESAQEFTPARPSLTNPLARTRGGANVHVGTLIDDPLAREVSAVFDEIYGLMLRMLQFAFDNSMPPSPLVRDLAGKSILLMVRVIKPLGEALTSLPAGPANPGRTAGPSFGLSRHVPLPRNEQIAAIMSAEQLKELSTSLQNLALGFKEIPTLRAAAENLRQIASGAAIGGSRCPLGYGIS
jgi:hypothetical protein